MNAAIGNMMRSPSIETGRANPRSGLLRALRRVALALVVASPFAIAGCANSDDAQPPAGPVQAPPIAPADPGAPAAVEAVVGAAGATLASASGALQLVISPGALDGNRSISATAFSTAMPPVAGVVPGTGYVFGPDGLDFARPVQLGIRYDPAQLPAGFDEANLLLAKIRDDGTRELARNIQVDTATRTVRGEITGFSSWGIITECNGLIPAVPEITVQSTEQHKVTLQIGLFVKEGRTSCPSTQYEVWRAVAQGASEPVDSQYQSVGFVRPPAVTNVPLMVTFVDGRLAPGTSYRYRVTKQVTTASGLVPIDYAPGLSVLATTLPAAVASPPAAPGHFVAAPDYAIQGPYFVTGVGLRIHLNWSPVPEGEHYVLERREPNAQFAQIAELSGATEYFDVIALSTAQRQYEYRLTAVNAAGVGPAVTASVTMEPGVFADTFCFVNDAGDRCAFGEIKKFKVEAGRQASIPFRISPPAYQVFGGSPPVIFGSCDIYFALFNPGHGISQAATGAFSELPLQTSPNAPLSGSNYPVTMTLDVANGASIGVHYATLYATGCLGPVVAKQAIALDVRPAGLPNRLTVEVFGGGVVASTNVTGIDCGIDCEEDYALNAQVILTATAVPGAMFTGWTGDCQASPNQPDQASFPMDKDRTCHATFTLQPVSTTNAHIVAGHFYSVARKSGGAALSWGIDSGEELGNGPGNASRNAPGPIAVIGDAIALGGLYGGNGNGFVVRASGEVWGWGGDAFGQLGDGVTSAVPNGTPLAMTDTSGAVVTNATAVASGAGHTVVLLANGDVLAVGVNSSGELGDGSPSGPRPRAAAVTGLTNVRAIGAGSHFSMALRTDGTVWTWGANNQGQLGDPAVASRPLPGQVAGLANIVAIAAGAEFALALDANGDVWAWGANGNGELGDASGVANRAAPGRVSLAGATAIAAGQNHAFAIKGGALYGWGRNASAQLGLGDTQPRAAPVAIGGIGNVVEVAGGNSHSLAVDANGDVWAWGSNGSGELGIGTGQLSAPTPVRVPGLNVN